MDKIITITNTTGTFVSLSPSFTITGSHAADYNFKGGSYPGAGGSCVGGISGYGSCTVVVTFTPSAINGRYATLNINYNTSKSLPLYLQWSIGTLIIQVFFECAAPFLIFSNFSGLKIEISNKYNCKTEFSKNCSAKDFVIFNAKSGSAIISILDFTSGTSPLLFCHYPDLNLSHRISSCPKIMTDLQNA